MPKRSPKKGRPKAWAVIVPWLREIVVTALGGLLLAFLVKLLRLKP